jgi:hypothetical protein
MKAMAVIILVLGLAATSHQAPAREKDLVPDLETAIGVSKVILTPIYGKKFVQDKEFTAELRDGVWVVVGKPKPRKGMVISGGTIRLEIEAADVKVRDIYLEL